MNNDLESVDALIDALGKGLGANVLPVFFSSVPSEVKTGSIGIRKVVEKVHDG